VNLVAYLPVSPKLATVVTGSGRTSALDLGTRRSTDFGYQPAGRRQHRTPIQSYLHHPLTPPER
jgi:hypothetical protein